MTYLNEEIGEDIPEGKSHYLIMFEKEWLFSIESLKLSKTFFLKIIKYYFLKIINWVIIDDAWKWS